MPSNIHLFDNVGAEEDLVDLDGRIAPFELFVPFEELGRSMGSDFEFTVAIGGLGKGHNQDIILASDLLLDEPIL